MERYEQFASYRIENAQEVQKSNRFFGFGSGSQGQRALRRWTEGRTCMSVMRPPTLLLAGEFTVAGCC
jgi:hypothetical protein